MKRTIVRYKTKPETAQENERLIQQVFQELRAKSPQAVRYLALVRIPVRAEIAPGFSASPSRSGGLPPTLTASLNP